MSDATKTIPLGVTIPRTPEELQALLKRTQAGDPKTLPVVRKMLENPANVEVFGGNLAEAAERAFATAIAGKDVGMCEAVLRRMELLREELLDESESPIERVVVERVVACWLQLQDAELRLAREPADSERLWKREKRAEAVERRFLSSVKALALVRRLGAATLQVNVAEKPINAIPPKAS